MFVCTYSVLCEYIYEWVATCARLSYSGRATASWAAAFHLMPFPSRAMYRKLEHRWLAILGKAAAAARASPAGRHFYPPSQNPTPHLPLTAFQARHRSRARPTGFLDSDRKSLSRKTTHMTLFSDPISKAAGCAQMHTPPACLPHALTACVSSKFTWTPQLARPVPDTPAVPLLRPDMQLQALDRAILHRCIPLLPLHPKTRARPPFSPIGES